MKDNQHVIIAMSKSLFCRMALSEFAKPLPHFNTCRVVSAFGDTLYVRATTRRGGRVTAHTTDELDMEPHEQVTMTDSKASVK